jgi:hypothetical protein
VITPSPLALLAILVVVLGGVSLLPRRDVRHPLAGVLRVLLPSWRFFDDVQDTPMLLVRVAAPERPFGAWRPLLVPQARRLSHLLWNPDGNLRLAQHALLERLLADLADWDEGRDPPPESLVSYQLVQHLVVTCVAADDDGALAVADGGARPRRYQFKLVEVPETLEAVGGDLLISREHEA